MSKHTPGPWYANGAYVSKIRDSGYTLPITRVYNQQSGSPGIEPDMTLAEAQANARLIAAAPDLLAALKAVTPHAFGHSKPGCKGGVRDPENCDVCKAIWAARDAIDKAEGGA